MDIGVLGLGRMGLNIARRLMASGHRVVAYDVDQGALQKATEAGAEASTTLESFRTLLKPPRAVWVMLPCGDPTEKALESLSEVLEAGDTIIDGGNSNYKHSIERASKLAAKGIGFLDVGTSGGIWGLENGYCLMIGGDDATVARLQPIFQSLAPAPDMGWVHVGPSGAGHFAKMVHNGIEYGMMQALAEGLEILHKKDGLVRDLAEVAETWRHGSVVRSWLLDLAASGLSEDADLASLKGYVDDSGEGRWTLEEAIDLDVAAPVIASALFARFSTRQPDAFSNKVLAMLRQKFGGHPVRRSD